jgi:hypothetical protein
MADAEKTLNENRRRQQDAVMRQQALEAASKPTPTQEEMDRVKLGLPVELEPSGLPVDTSVHPTDAFRDRMLTDPNASKPRESGSR